MNQLTRGSIVSIYNDIEISAPVLQIIHLKAVQNQGKADRYRVVLSDGQHYMQAMFGTQHGDRIRSGEVNIYHLIRLDEYTVNSVKNRRILLILNFEVANNSINEQLGSPTDVEQAKNTPQQQPPQPQRQNNTANSSSTPSNRNQSQPQKTNPVAPSNSKANPSNKSRAVEKEEGPIMPISSLNPYTIGNRWCIKVRVLQKSQVKTWSNARGTGQLASVDLVDAQDSKIRATMFNDVVTKFHPFLQENSVYTIRNGRIKNADRRFSTIDNEYELNLEANSLVDQVDDDGSIPGRTFDFIQIANLPSYVGNTVDVVGIVTEVEDCRKITTKKNNEVTKRNVRILDDTSKAIDISFWGATAENFKTQRGSVIVVKGALVSDYNGVTLSTTSSSTIVEDPVHIERAAALQGWYETESQNGAPVSESLSTFSGSGASSSGRKTVAQIKDENLGADSSKGVVFITTATITFIKHDGNMYYAACPNPECKNKKVTSLDASKNLWYCEQCKNQHTSPEYRYVVPLTISDHTGSAYVTAFNDIGTNIFGQKNASDLETERNGDPQQFEATIQEATFKKYEFKVRAKHEVVPNLGDTRQKCILLGAKPIGNSLVEEGTRLLQEIKSLM